MRQALVTLGVVALALSISGSEHQTASAQTDAPLRAAPRTESAGVQDTASTPPSAEAPEATRQVGRELEELARAWDAGGGRYGYPFWEKAWQRWQDREIGASMFREYVTGYRDLLRPGCDLVASVDTSTPLGTSTKERLRDACDARLDALGLQERRLEELIDGGSSVDGARSAALEAEYDASLQRSYERTRQAMNEAQAGLEALGLARLPEDAFR